MDELGRESLHPPVYRDLVDLDTALGQHLFDVSVGQAAAHNERDDLAKPIPAGANPDPVTRPVFRQLGSANAIGAIVVIEGAGQMIGFGVVGASRDDDAADAQVGELQAIYLDSRWWGHGFGAWLIEAATALLVDAGCSGDAVGSGQERSRARVL